MYQVIRKMAKEAKNEFSLLKCSFSVSQLDLVKRDYIVRKRVDFKC